MVKYIDIADDIRKKIETSVYDHGQKSPMSMSYVPIIGAIKRP